MNKKKKIRKHKSDKVDIWTEEEYEEYLKGLYGMDYIAGFTENGVPYGLFVENQDDMGKFTTYKPDDTSNSDDDLPF